MEKIKILLAEDDENMGTLLRDYLTVKGCEVNWASNGELAVQQFAPSEYDICILDVTMPKKDGFTVAREIRLLSPQVPIIFLTAKSMSADIMEGFAAGADDYMTKPFSIEELILRIEAILRRTKDVREIAVQEEIFKIGNYTFNFTKQMLTNAKGKHSLTAKEAELLRLLCINKNQVLDRSFALNAIWVNDTYYNTRSMDVYITKLRNYIKDDPSISIISVRGRGFKLIA